MEIGFNNVSYNYRIKELNYNFEDGKITCLIGNSGSGKSLIGYLLMGIVKPSSGYVIVDGKRIYDFKSLKKDIGYVFQNPLNHIFCNTVYDEVSYGLKVYKFKVGKEDIQVSKALKMVGLDDSYFNINPRCLSVGEIERVAIASSLVMNPKILILDEPYVYLDNKGIMELNKLLRMLRDKYHKTIIVISNDISNCSDILDNYVLLDNGSIVSAGSGNNIISNGDIFKKYDVDISDIFSFIDLCNSKGISIKYTGCLDELVRDVIDNV